jgi:hypothetical protein
MYGHFIRKRHNPQVAALQLWNLALESVAIALLALGPKRLLEYACAPLLSDVRTLAENLFLEIFGESVLSHVDRLPRLLTRSILPFNVRGEAR